MSIFENRNPVKALDMEWKHRKEYEERQKQERSKNMKLSRLYSHQREDVKQLYLRECSGNLKEGCIIDGKLAKTSSNITILSSPLGSGKTRSVCAFLAKCGSSLFRTNKVCFYEAIFSHGKTTSFVKGSESVYESTIIIVNSSIFRQWKDELDYWEVPTICYSSLFDPLPDFQQNGKIFLVTIQHFPRQQWNLLDAQMARIIIDEPDTLSIAHCPNFGHCRFLLLVTSTPQNLCKVKNHGFIRQMFCQMPKCVLQTLTISHTEEEISKSIILPSPKQIKVYFQKNRIIDSVLGYVTPEIRKLLEEGSYAEARRALGAKAYSKDSIFDLIEKNIQKKMKQMQKTINASKLILDSGMELSVELQQLYQKALQYIENNQNTKELQTSVQNNLESECSICLQQMEAPTLCPSCYLHFCLECINEWMQTSFSRFKCPQCKIYISNNTLIHVQVDDTYSLRKSIPSDEKILSSREVALRHTLLEIQESDKDAKILIFCGSPSIMKKTNAVIERNDDILFSYKNFKGNQRTRANILQQFKREKGNCNILLLHSKMDSAGLNIPEANHIILCHRMTESVKKQMIGRANRPGRNTQVLLKVYELEPK